MSNSENMLDLNQFRDHIHRYLDDALTENESLDLLKQLEHSPEKSSLFAEMGTLDELIAEAMPSVDQSTGELVHPNASPVPMKKKHSLRTFVAALAASIVLVATITFLFFGANDNKPITTEVVHAAGALWEDGNSVRNGQRIENGQKHHLAQGVVAVRFADGTNVAIEGPAEFRILGSAHLELSLGVATAHVPDSAKGFKITSQTATVVDLGTDFGIRVSNDGKTDVAVFDGEVTVERIGMGSEERSNPKHVMEGEAIRVRRDRATVETVEYDTTSFKNAWPVSSGVLQTSGLLRFVDPGPKFIPGRYEDSDHILIFPERRAIQLKEPLAVDLNEPGEYARMRRDEVAHIESKQIIRSFLVQLDPIGQTEKFADGKIHAFGQITFEREIVGVIANKAKLRATDMLLGHPDADYGDHPRGLEPPRRDETGRDSVILTADRRTLIIHLAAGSAVDQLRVLVKD